MSSIFTDEKLWENEWIKQIKKKEDLKRCTKCLYDEETPNISFDLFEMILKRFGYDLDDFEKLMLLPKKTYKDYKTYKPMFERLRPFFYVMTKAELIPWSFYQKYTSKDNI